MKEYIKYGIGITLGLAIGNMIVEAAKQIIIKDKDSKKETQS